jgi:ferrochelatase
MSTPNKPGKIGVLLMTYGSATTAEHVREYFERIYPGKATDFLIADFENRYTQVGYSPLIEITQKQAAALEQKLGSQYVVRAGMRHSAPFIQDAMKECVDAGADEMRGIILSPQFSSFIMEGYKKDFLKAIEELGIKKSSIAEPWPNEFHFITLLAKRTHEALHQLGVDTPVIFTTHSLPQRVVEADPSYMKQLQKTIDAVRAKLSTELSWYQGFQSAGHTPEDWLTPDVNDIIRDIRKQGHRKVLIVPIQFLADHLEILYDLDIALRAECEKQGVLYNRIALPNTDPLFIEALAAVAASVVY